MDLINEKRQKDGQNKTLRNFHSLQNIIGVMKTRSVWAGHVAHMKAMRYGYKITVRKPERMRPLGIHNHRWKSG
jgi:hypothetical protein